MLRVIAERLKPKLFAMSEKVILQHAAEAGTDFLLYTGNFCGYCTAAKRLFESKNFSFKEYNFDEYSGLRQDVVAATGHRTVPVIFDLRDGNVTFIGGFDETNAYLR
tara:strand:+ start:906 stop:1226 length:321 start_codon:yes stop_codon:yes gene_type:complete